MAANMYNCTSRRPGGRLIGYARVSTDEQATQAQDMELRSAGCETIVEEHGSSASRARPALSAIIQDIGVGDTLVLVHLDRLARADTLNEIANQLERLHERTPRGGTKWAPSSVKNLIDRAERSGLLDACETELPGCAIGANAVLIAHLHPSQNMANKQ